MAAAIKSSFSVQEVVSFLKERVPTISEDVLKRIEDQRIDGEVFLALDDEYMREIAPLLGDRVKLKKVLNSATSSVSVNQEKEIVNVS